MVPLAAFSGVDALVVQLRVDRVGSDLARVELGPELGEDHLAALGVRVERRRLVVTALQLQVVCVQALRVHPAG